MRENAKMQEVGLLTGTIWKQQLKFFFPILFGIFFQQLYNTVDALIVGRFVGKEALACISGSPGVLTTLIIGLFNGLSTGAMVAISQFFGAKDLKRLNRAVYTTLALAAIGSIAITISFSALMKPILVMMHTPESLMDGSLLYLYIYFGGIIFTFLYFSGSAILRAIGDSRRPMLFLIFCCVLNTILDLLFVAVFQWGIMGAAVATVISQAVSAVLVCRTVFYRVEELDLQFRKIRIDFDILRFMLKIGLPAGIQSMLYDIANMMIMTAINGLGVDTVAAWAAIGKIDAFFWMVNNAFGTTIATFTGIHYGAGKVERLKKGVKQCLILALCGALIVMAILLLGGRWFLYAFVSDWGVVQIGWEMMLGIVPFYFVFEFVEIRVSALRSEGDVIIPAVIVFFTTCVLRLIWIFYIMFRGEYTAVEAILCYPVSWILSAIVFSLYFGPKQNKLLSSIKK